MRDAQLVMPDQHDVLERLSLSGAETMREICRRYGFLGDVSYFTCFACLLSDKRLHALMPPRDVRGYLDSKRGQLEAIMRRYRADHGFWPSPLVLFEESLEASVRCGGSFPKLSMRKRRVQGSIASEDASHCLLLVLVFCVSGIYRCRYVYDGWVNREDGTDVSKKRLRRCVMVLA